MSLARPTAPPQLHPARRLVNLVAYHWPGSRTTPLLPTWSCWIWAGLGLVRATKLAWLRLHPLHRGGPYTTTPPPVKPTTRGGLGQRPELLDAADGHLSLMLLERLPPSRRSRPPDRGSCRVAGCPTCLGAVVRVLSGRCRRVHAARHLGQAPLPLYICYSYLSLVKRVACNK